jgi:predicted nuclease of predicted toxin-antitoxin system
MSLLFDENISRNLVGLLALEFPGSVHVATLDMLETPDIDLWNYAAVRGLCVVTKDDDFRQRALLVGPPPKVIWFSVGNASTKLVAGILNSRADAIRLFLNDPEAGLFILTRLADH